MAGVRLLPTSYTLAVYNTALVWCIPPTTDEPPDTPLEGVGGVTKPKGRQAAHTLWKKELKKTEHPPTTTTISTINPAFWGVQIAQNIIIL